jgi:Holliday junction resolvase RusA-like endonuclease
MSEHTHIPRTYELTIPGDPIPWSPKQTNPKSGTKFVAARQSKHAGKIIDCWERRHPGVWFEKGDALVIQGVFWIGRPKSHYGTGRNARVLKPAAPPYPTGRPDGSNLLKLVEDALTTIAWADDDQFIDGVFRKRYCDWWAAPYSEIKITPL